MKRTVGVLFLAVLTLLALSALAGAPTEYPVPEVGTELCGFVVTDVSQWNTYATDIVELTHQKTGSVLYWLANDSINRSYMIAFKTPAKDNTGMPHVFEHATLGGSQKYPGANTFFEMNAKTSQTYLNALTGQYDTLYPMATTSEEQLYQDIDYYMNGLTEPLALTNPYALMREAYRYELDDPEGEIGLQGVVYSEMLGALSLQRWADLNYKRMLWPGSRASTVSGGDPKYIPDLTVEALRSFHETYYHPSNATMYLTGDLDLPVFLSLLDGEFLSRFEKAEISVEDDGYTPIAPGRYEQVFSYPVEAGTPVDHAAVLYYALPFEMGEYEELTLLDFAAACMNDESSLFKRLVIQRFPQASVSVSCPWEADGKVCITFMAQGLDEQDKDLFRDTCDEALADLLQNGVDGTVLKAILVNKRFSDLMSVDNSSIYLSLSQNMATLWPLFDRRDVWKEQAELEAHLEERVSVESVNEAVKRYWSGLDTSVLAVTVPVPGLKEEQDQELRGRLAAMKAAMSPEEVEALVARTKEYRAFVEESNQIPMPESLNALSSENLPEEIAYTPAEETNIGGIRLLTSEIDSPLVRISINTEAGVIPFDELFDFMEFSALTGRMATEKYEREELPARASALTNSLSLVEPAHMEHPATREYLDRVVTSWYALPETLEESFELVEEILYHTDYSDYDFIRREAARSRTQYLASLESSSLTRGIRTASSVYSPNVRLSDYLSSEAYLQYLDKVSHMTDAELDGLTSKFETFRRMILNRGDVILTVIGNKENILRATALGYQLCSGFDTTHYEKQEYRENLAAPDRHTALVTGGNVVYNIAMTNLEEAGFERVDGGLNVVSKILDDKLLYPEIRVKNSAYGAYTLLDGYLFGFYSYRDPGAADTYAVYESAGAFLKELEISESELEGYIISAYGELTAPVGTLGAALNGISDKSYGMDSKGETLKRIRDLKAFTAEDIKRYAPLAEQAGSEEAARVTVGTKTIIDENSALFDSVNEELFKAAAAQAQPAQ